MAEKDKKEILSALILRQRRLLNKIKQGLNASYTLFGLIILLISVLPTFASSSENNFTILEMGLLSINYADHILIFYVALILLNVANILVTALILVRKKKYRKVTEAISVLKSKIK